MIAFDPVHALLVTGMICVLVAFLVIGVDAWLLRRRKR